MQTRPRRTRAPQERPAQILDAAARLLLRTGAGATIDEIAAEAGLGKGTVYEYFGSKTQIFTGLRSRYTKQTIEAGERAMAAGPDGPAIERIRRFVAGMFDHSIANGALIDVLFHHVGIDEHDELRPIGVRMLELVREGVRAGELDVADPAFTVDFLMHGLHGVMETLPGDGRPTRRLLSKVDKVVVALLNPVS
jgi:AcrR family transcriptional regulator